MRIRNVVVGAGFAGSTIARRIAEEREEEVFVVEQKAHVGGHAFDAYNEQGILVHVYGPHIFHTNSDTVWKWASRFTSWFHYQHRVLAYVQGRFVPFPISIETVRELYNQVVAPEELEDWLAKRAIDTGAQRNAEDVLLASVGSELYELFYKNYTTKQWGKEPSQIDVAVVKRIPIRSNRDTRYFADKYQGMPSRGYTEMFGRILDHPRIRLMLKTKWQDVRKQVAYDRLYYTGRMDEYFDKRHGDLEYRSVRFEYQTFFDREYYQPAGVVNYPNDYDFTRITEYKHLTGQKMPHTTISREYPVAEGDPYYVVTDEKNRERASLYQADLLKEGEVVFLGRLAEHKYYNMDQVIARALSIDLK